MSRHLVDPNSAHANRSGASSQERGCNGSCVARQWQLPCCLCVLPASPTWSSSWQQQGQQRLCHLQRPAPLPGWGAGPAVLALARLSCRMRRQRGRLAQSQSGSCHARQRTTSPAQHCHQQAPSALHSNTSEEHIHMHRGYGCPTNNTKAKKARQQARFVKLFVMHCARAHMR